jgi:hypothetical protein
MGAEAVEAAKDVEGVRRGHDLLPGLVDGLREYRRQGRPNSSPAGRIDRLLDPALDER